MEETTLHMIGNRSTMDEDDRTKTTTTMRRETTSNYAKYGIDSSCSSTTATTHNNTQKRLTFDTLLALQLREAHAKEHMPEQVALDLSRLCGGAGGENSGNGSGWGSPPSGSGVVPNPNIVGSWGTAAGASGNPSGGGVGGGPNQPQPQGPGQQLGSGPGGVAGGQPPQANPIAPGVAGGGGPPNNGNNPNNGANNQAAQQQQGMNVPNAQPQQPQPGAGVAGPGAVGAPSGAATTKHQLEQLNTMRDALFAQDGWGCQHVNQDTNWEVPSSPDLKDGGWKPCTANNGCELWEQNLRNGGAPPAPPAQKAPWSHTPASNIGGTWGEDDDVGDSANVWTGTPTNPQAPMWGNNAGPSGGVPPVTPGSAGVGAGPGAPGMWPNANPAVKKDGDWPGAAPGGNWGGANPLAEPREMRAPSADPRLIDPRDQLRGDPRGGTGRVNGAADPMWGQHHGLGQHGQMGMNKMAAPGGNGGNAGPWPGSSMPKDIPVPKQSGWDEPSPPNQRRPFDDGTTLWGQRQPPQQQPRMPGGAGNQWKDADPRLVRANSSGLPGGPAPQIPPNRGPMGMKPDGWGPNAGRNGGTPWEDNANHGMSWDDKLGGGGGSGSQWGDSSAGAGVWNKNKAGPMWPEGGDMSDWGGHNVGKDLSKMPPTGGNSVDLMRTEPYRILYQMGFKKEDIEQSLRASNLNLDDALEMLKQRNSSMDSWARHDDHGSNFDQFPGGRFPGAGQPPAQFPSNLLGNSGAGSGISPNFVGGMQHPLGNLPPLGHQGQGGFNKPPPPTANQGGAAGQPSTLRMLVQQIKMAVQAGYLNPQILNQPLAPQTLVLLNTLLNLIKQLQMTAAAGRGNVNSIQAATKYKQQIANLQNQISAQQAIYMKQQQQQQQQQQNPHVDFLRGHQDPIVSLQNNFADMGMAKEPHNPFPNTSQQSRLNQWKLPPSDDVNDFGKNAAVLGLPSEGPWSSGRNVTDGWPDSNVDSENKDWPNTSQTSPGAAFTDLVAEFEPGKPWKGSQLKNIEDDPSITPGSVARSPLSISAAKESDLFGGMSSKTSPSDMSLNLSSSTWSYPNKLNNATTPSGGVASASELWGSSNPMSKGSRNPPPGLGGNGGSAAANGWSSGGGGGNASSGLSRGNSAWSGNSGGGGGGNWGAPSNWLLLKNLTTQIDGSTLRTLCMQHGPLQHFHLYLNHSIALCMYSTTEVAQKAQKALNNCVLGNTTICAESPSENEVQNILMHLGAPGAVTPVSTGQAPSWRPGQQGSRNSGNAAWPSSTGPNSLWGAPLEGGVVGGVSGAGTAASERGTPSNLNSFLPENLLGGELN